MIKAASEKERPACEHSDVTVVDSPLSDLI